MSRASLSPWPSNAVVPPPPSLRPPLSVDPCATPSWWREPLMGSSSTHPHYTPPPENQTDPSTRFLPGSSPFYTPCPPTTASLFNTAIERATGDWAGSSLDTTYSRSKSPESETISTGGRRSSKRSRPDEIGVNSISNRPKQESGCKRWRGSPTPATGIERRHSRLSPSPEVTLIDPLLTLGVGGCDRAEGGPHASRRVMTPASASRGSRA